jgi:hypothetical protein
MNEQTVEPEESFHEWLARYPRDDSKNPWDPHRPIVTFRTWLIEYPHKHHGFKKLAEEVRKDSMWRWEDTLPGLIKRTYKWHPRKGHWWEDEGFELRGYAKQAWEAYQQYIEDWYCPAPQLWRICD